MHKRLFTLLILGTMIGFTACNTGKKARERAALVDSLQYTYEQIGDSLNMAWEEMVEDDNEKIAYMKRLLDEVTYTNSYDQEKHDELLERVEQLQKMRYTRSSMRNDQLIDEYDLAIAAAINDVTSYARAHPEYDNYPLMAELISDIRQKDADVLLYRVKYDERARRHNRFVEKNEEYMEEIDPDYTRKIALFAIE